MAESPSEDQFRVLQREIRDAIRRNHPNPGRVGCVGSEKLAAMARGSLPTDDPAYSHVMECSPCYEELMVLTEEVEAQKRTATANRRRFAPAIAASVLVLVGVLAIWLYSRQSGDPRSPAPAQPDGQIAQNRPPIPAGELPLGVLNLESDSPTRGVDGAPDRVVQRLTRKKMNLVIYLPLGLDEGEYEVEVARPNGPALLNLKGTAQIENGLTTLRVQPDFTSLEPGRYELRYRRPSSSWRESVFSLR